MRAQYYMLRALNILWYNCHARNRHDTAYKRSAEMLEHLHRGRELRIFGRLYAKKTWRVGSVSRIRLAELFLRIFGCTLPQRKQRF